MIRTYLRTAFRNLLKRKTSTGINILCLAIGLASCSLVFLFVQHELAFDKGFDNTSNIYRVTSWFRDGSRAPTAPYPYASFLKQEIPEIDQISRLDASNSICTIRVPEASGSGQTTPYIEYSAYWVDPNFFDLFSYHFLYGNRKTALAAPNSIVLSENRALWLFPHSNPCGRLIQVGNQAYTVTGVIKQDILNHIDPGFIASNNSIGIREHLQKITNWVTDPNYYTYLRLKPGSNIQHVNDELRAYTQRHALPDMKASNSYMTNTLQALGDIHLHSADYYDYLADKQGSLSYLYLLISIAIAVLVLGCINYMNLSTAHAVDRAREVGVRRVLGAAKKTIRLQFLVETLVVSGCAFLLACILAITALPHFNSFTGQNLSFFARENRSLFGWVVLITGLAGLTASIYPGYYLSKFQPVKVLKGKISDRGSLFAIRKVLVAGQFVISTCLILATLVIGGQLNYMINANTGTELSQQITLSLHDARSSANGPLLMQQLQQSTQFQSVTGAAAPFLSGDMNLYPSTKSITEKKDIFLDLVDQNYLPTLGLSLLAGSNFSPETFSNTDMRQDLEVSHDAGHQVILNEEAVKALGFPTPQSAIDQSLSHLHEGVVYQYTVRGVVKNYHYFSLHAPIGPMALMLTNPRRFATIIARVKDPKMAAAIKFSEAKWKEMNPESPLDLRFLKDMFEYDYNTDRRQQQMIRGFTVIAILISCLGLLGLITYTLGQKAKEISIRKVIGAGVTDIVLLFSKQYLLLVVIANLIAWPLATWFLNNWLQPLAFHITISWWMYALSLAAGLFITLLTLSFKTIKAAQTNPVMNLKDSN